MDDHLRLGCRPERCGPTYHGHTMKEMKTTVLTLVTNRRVVEIEMERNDVPRSIETFQSPSGPFQVHFYRNSASGAVSYTHDYKVVFNGPR